MGPKPLPCGQPLQEGFVEPRGIGRIRVDQIEALPLGCLQPANDLLLDDAQGWPWLQAGGHRLQVAACDRADAPVLLDRHHLGRAPQEGFAAHHATAAEEIQPVGAGEFRRQHVHDRQADARGGRPGDLSRGTLQFAPPAEPQAHAWASTQLSQRRSSCSPASEDFSGWNWQAPTLPCQTAAVTG